MSYFGNYFGTDSNLAMILALLLTLQSAQITVTSPVTALTNTLILTRGDDYTATTGQPITFWSAGWPSLASATLNLYVRNATTFSTLLTASGSAAPSIQNGVSGQLLTFTATGTQTNNLVPDPTGTLQIYEATATWIGSPNQQRTLLIGDVIVNNAIRW